jgi:transposase-like protein
MESLARRVHSSWRVDETYIGVRGKWHYLYRAVDKHGKTVDFLLRPDRGIAAAQTFFRKALTTSLPRWPRKVTLDGDVPSHRALRLLRREDPKWKYVVVRSCRYLNNIVEQDHRAIKRRCAWMTGLSRLGMQPSRSPESSWRIEFENGRFHSASAVSGGHGH